MGDLVDSSAGAFRLSLFRLLGPVPIGVTLPLTDEASVGAYVGPSLVLTPSVLLVFFFFFFLSSCDPVLSPRHRCLTACQVSVQSGTTPIH
jgi:hypothetical protein